VNEQTTESVHEQASPEQVLFECEASGQNNVSYVLTNLRALIMNKQDRNNPFVISQCDLTQIVPLAQNKHKVRHDHGDQQTEIIYGDVSFMKGASAATIFYGVPGPDDIVNTVNQLKKSYFLD